jgi:hypothetical protein
MAMKLMERPRTPGGAKTPIGKHGRFRFVANWKGRLTGPFRTERCNPPLISAAAPRLSNDPPLAAAGESKAVFQAA